MSLLSASDNQIPLFTNTSRDWHTKGEEANYAVDLNTGMNEYIFGRTTPDNKFVVSTGLVSDSKNGIEMTGAGKKKRKTVLNKTKKVLGSFGSSVGTFLKKVKDSLVGKSKTNPIKKVSEKSSTKKSKKVLSSVTSSIGSFISKVKDTVTGKSKKKVVKKVSSKPKTALKKKVVKK